jgi:hypothetical protein
VTLLITISITIELLQAVGLLTAITMQLEYLPVTEAGCKHYNGPAAVRDMFFREAAAKMKTDKKHKGPPNPYEVCKDYTGSVYLAIYIMCVHQVLATKPYANQLLGLSSYSWLDCVYGALGGRP